jgi:hypothetical protein
VSAIHDIFLLYQKKIIIKNCRENNEKRHGSRLDRYVILTFGIFKISEPFERCQHRRWSRYTASICPVPLRRSLDSISNCFGLPYRPYGRPRMLVFPVPRKCMQFPTEWYGSHTAPGILSRSNLSCLLGLLPAKRYTSPRNGLIEFLFFGE